jgi:magnesium-protoporphyrin IX monomethyl ester (oxidative) cyclase
VDISKQVFPVLVDVENPAFLAGLRTLRRLATELDDARSRRSLLGRLRGLTLQARIVATLVALFFLPTKRNALPDQTRLSPAW